MSELELRELQADCALAHRRLNLTLLTTTIQSVAIIALAIGLMLR